MKYYIEFELPDNDVVLEGIEHEWVRWSVWGYSGYAYAKPVACEKPDLSTMLFSERKELADKYEQWAKKNCVEDCALSVISYLCAFGYIPTLFNRERKRTTTHEKTHSCVSEHTETHACVSPCDICRHYPPSSADGKPCSMCPAEPAEPTEQVRTYVSLAECVSKQAAIHAAIEAVDEWDGGYNLARADKIISAIKKLPSAEPEWIHVSERLPDKRATVIVSCIDNSGDTLFSYTACGYWVGVLPDDDPTWIVDDEINYHVVAWMPLPEPWEGE